MIHVTSLRVHLHGVEIGVHRKPEFAGHASYYTTVSRYDDRRGTFWARFLAAIAFCDLRLRVKG